MQFVVDGKLSKRICGRRKQEYNLFQVGPFDHDVVFEGIFKSDKKRSGHSWDDVQIGHVPITDLENYTPNEKANPLPMERDNTEKLRNFEPK